MSEVDIYKKIYELQKELDLEKWLNEQCRKQGETYANYNDELLERINKAIEYFEYQLSQLDFEKDTMAKMLCAMALVILRGEDK